MTPNEAAALANLLQRVADDLDHLLHELRITSPPDSRERLELYRLRHGLPGIITFLTARARNVRKLLEHQEAQP